MNQLYVVNDADGFICAFRTKNEAEDFICKHGKEHRLYVMVFNNDSAMDDDNTVWFLPYRDLHVPAVVSSNVQYVKNIQLQLLNMGLVYADNVDFYMRKIGELGLFEEHRLLLPDMDDADADADADARYNLHHSSHHSSHHSPHHSSHHSSHHSTPPPPSTPIASPIMMEQPQLIAEAITKAIQASCKDYITKEEHILPTAELDCQIPSDTQDSS